MWANFGSSSDGGYIFWPNIISREPVKYSPFVPELQENWSDVAFNSRNIAGSDIVDNAIGDKSTKKRPLS